MRRCIAGAMVLICSIFIVATTGAQAGSMQYQHTTDKSHPLMLIADAGNSISDEHSTISADSAIYDSGPLSISAWRMKLSTQTFESDRAQSGYLRITKSSPDLNITAGLLSLNHRTISLTSFLRGKDSSLKIKVKLRRINHLKLIMIGACGASIRITAHVETTAEEEPPLPEVTFSASAESIAAGDSCTLSWSTAHADQVSIDQGIGAVDLNGAMTVRPTADITYTLTAEGPGGSVTGTAAVKVVSPFTIEINSPSNGESISRPDVLVRGTFANPGDIETGISVNGRTAMIFGSQFVVNHVPLTAGENTVTAIAIDADGNIQQTAISVFAEIPDQYIEVITDISSGGAPLTVDLSVRGSFSLGNPTLTRSGPGTAEFIQTGDNEYRIDLADEGIHYFTAEAAYGTKVYADTIAVVVVDTAKIDVLLQRKWEDMKRRLGNGDIAGALSHFSESTKPMFEYNFNLLKDHMTEIMTGMKGISLIKIEEDQAQYNLEAEQGGQRFSFHLLFMKNRDGLWRIVNF